MKITEQDVRHVAALAHLELSAEESARLVRDLGATLAYIDQLNRLDTTGVPPTAQAPLPPGEAGAGLRPDEVRPSLPRTEALGNAPAAAEAAGEPAFFQVPKVIAGR